MLKKRRLPPLNALKAFEATARTGSLSLAAEELSVSASAVSQQVRSLEQWLGLSLFDRGANFIELTKTGATYLAGLTVMFDRLDEMTEALQNKKAPRKLRLSVLPSFAAEWLGPRVKKFRKANPSIQLEILTSDQLVDFSDGSVDLAIRYGPGNYKGLTSELLMGEMIGPACHPDLLNEGDFFSRITLLRDAGGPEGIRLSLEEWLDDFARESPAGHDSYSFSDTHLLINAARNGEGLMLGRSVLIADDVLSGRLVPVLGKWTKSPFSYYLVSSAVRELTPDGRLFRKWLLAEISEFESNMPEALRRQE
ncbi:LysR substrate-binding domain-containing protein [Kiloniella laminariae]|uniref:LysR substrate-binding domain-containing protein n=1 Tax=Kiloniella laminariae TaxID=454162 RepID=A0ABT4LJC0_9PROT|nr:LysR substrate-binding domain-containing protein [Kiloniella laminariae]MCZ4280092.1 LysR substrate-binding domain-containing protein [Kiloniella laminariae]